MTKKIRQPVPRDEAASALFLSDGTCCKCRIAGKTVQVHHIDDDPANSEASNLAILCLECHNLTQVRGGFGRQLMATDVVQYRDDWLLRVRNRRDSADALAASAMSTMSARSDAGASITASSWSPPEVPPELPSRAGLTEYVRMLPDLRRRAYALMHDKKPRTTLDTVEAYFGLIAVLEGALATLLSYYPECHFSDKGFDYYVSSLIADRTHWHYLRTSSFGVERSGTIVQVLTVLGVIRDVERMIEETVSTLTGFELRAKHDDAEVAWHEAWHEEIAEEDEGA
jgi:hypothetical protein